MTCEVPRASVQHGRSGASQSSDSTSRLLPLLLLTLLSATPLRAQLVVDPLEVELSAARPVAIVTIKNESATAQQATLSTGDWDRSESGDNRFFQLATQRGSCGGAISVFPLALRLEPHGTQTVRIALLGTSAADECWSVIFVEQAAPQSTVARFGISYSFRTAVKVYALPSVRRRDGEIDSVALRSDSATPGRQQLVIGFHNIGSSHENAHGSVEIRRPDNSVAAKLDIPGFPTLPGAHRSVTLALPPLPRGRYIALAVLDFGGQEITAGELEFESH